MTKPLFDKATDWSLRTLRSAGWMLLIALLLAQTVGVMHRVAHAQLRTDVLSHPTAETPSSLTAIWGEHNNSVDCQLFDQSCPDLLHVPFFWALLVVAVPLWVAASLRERFALFARFYAARGPPAFLL